MSNTSLPSKIQKAIDEGRLIPYEKIFNSYSRKEQERIRRGAKKIMLSMELRRLRKEHKLSQEKLAKKMNVKREYIAKLESGKQNVTINTLHRIADATGTEFTFRFE